MEKKENNGIYDAITSRWQSSKIYSKITTFCREFGWAPARKTDYSLIRKENITKNDKNYCHKVNQA